MFRVCISLCLLFFSGTLIAQETKRPKWEFGAALGSQYLADYRGSDEYNGRALVVPFFVYRGDRFKVDRRGIRGDLLSTPRWEINVSGEVSLSGGREDNQRRNGMPTLDSTFELGPSLNINLSGDSFDEGWLLRLPVRSVISVGDGVGYVGYLLNPKLTYTKNNIGHGWRSSTSVGLTYGSDDYHDYYYSVEPRFALDDRPAFDAGAGFSGLYFKTSIGRRVGLWRYGMSVRYDNIGDAAFADSPLVETDHYFAVSILLARYFWASDN